MLPLLAPLIKVYTLRGNITNYRTSTGGRFPSDLNINRSRNLDAPQSPSSDSSDRDTINATSAAPAVVPIIRTEEPARKYSRDDEDPYRLRGIASHSPGMTPGAGATYDDDQARYMANQQPYSAQPAQNQSFFQPGQQHLSQQPASAYQQAQPSQPTQPAHQTFDSPSNYGRDQSSSGDWIAPAAIGAGAGVAGTAAYNHYNNRDDQPDLQQQAARDSATVDDGALQQQAAKESALVDDGGVSPIPAAIPVSSIPSATGNAPISSERDIAAADNTVPAPVSPITTSVPDNGTYLSYPSNTGTGLAGSSDIPVSPMDGGLGGLESRGAHETGHIFPSVVRHNTDISVSQLHVPGEFPKKE